MYMHLLSQQIDSPNFWCSTEYFEKAKASVRYEFGWIGIKCDGQLLLPSLHPFAPMIACKNKFSIWTDLPNYHSNTLNKVFLDYNFIYEPQRFMDLSGSRWKVFRKNIRKWPRNNPEWVYKDITEDDTAALNTLMISWLGTKDGEIHDDEVIYQYLFFGKNRRGLYDDTGKLVGINIWDENYKYINYRFCFCEQTSFLSEFIRFLFYTDPSILAKKKLVNDGGSLGVPELFAFKNRLQPVAIFPVHSWQKK